MTQARSRRRRRRRRRLPLSPSSEQSDVLIPTDPNSARSKSTLRIFETPAWAGWHQLWRNDRDRSIVRQEQERSPTLEVRAVLPSPSTILSATAMAASQPVIVEPNGADSHLFSGSPTAGPSLTSVPLTLATATGSSPAPPPLAPTGTVQATGSLTSTASSTSASTSDHASGGGGGMNKNVQHLLIAVGCVAAFVAILLTVYAVFRIRRRATGGFWTYCMPQRKNDSLYRQLQAFGHGWDAKTIEGSEGKESLNTRSDLMTPTNYSPSPRSTPVMAPAPLRLNSTFIGRERNALVRASLNRHQLSTLEENSSYEYESELACDPPRIPPPSLAQQISHSATDARSTLSPSPEFIGVAKAVSPNPQATDGANQPNSPYTVAPLQPRKINIPPRSARSSWNTMSQPPTPHVIPPPADHPLPADQSVPRFRSVDHWADYQNRMAERDRSMTSGEYSQAFKDRDSTAESVDRRDSNGTVAVFRYHPGEEVPAVSGSTGDGSRVHTPPPHSVVEAGHQSTYLSPHPHLNPLAQHQPQPSLPSQPQPALYEPYRPYQPPPAPAVPTQAQQPHYPPPRRMHSAKNAQRTGPRYQYANVEAQPSTSSSSSGSSSSTSPVDPSQPQSSTTSSSSQQQQSSTTTTITNNNQPHQRNESEATVFKYHPGQEVMLDRSSKIKSEDLDAWFGRSASR